MKQNTGLSFIARYFASRVTGAINRNSRKVSAARRPLWLPQHCFLNGLHSAFQTCNLLCGAGTFASTTLHTDRGLWEHRP